MQHRPRHANPAGPPALSWDAAVGPALLLVAAMVAVSLPASDLTLHTTRDGLHPRPSPLPATSQPVARDWWGGREDP